MNKYMVAFMYRASAASAWRSHTTIVRGYNPEHAKSVIKQAVKLVGWEVSGTIAVEKTNPYLETCTNES